MKKSYGFEVSLNGSKIARAGIAKENYVVNCIVDAVRRKDGSSELFLQVGGLDSEADIHVSWYSDELKKGDKIVVEVIDENFDEPVHASRRISNDERIQQKLKYFHELKEELKDYL
jgi:hypothetical protein